MTVEILLPTWNGARFLPALLDSLLGQTFGDFTVLVRDDGSSDDTPAVLGGYARRDRRVRVLDPGGGRLGAAGNVSALLERSTARFTLLCDQDDLWNPDKVERSIQRLLRAETHQGPERPLLVHGDLEVVAEDLTPIASSFWRYRSLDPRRGLRFSRLLVRNLAVGCTMAMNAALRSLVTPIPSAAYMHDWWIALTAAALGRIETIDEPLLRYRQHGANTIGAGVGVGADLLRVLREPSRLRRYYHRTRGQAAAFVERFGDRMSDPDRHAAMLYARGGRSLLRPLSLLRADIRDSNALRQLALSLMG